MPSITASSNSGLSLHLEELVSWLRTGFPLTSCDAPSGATPSCFTVIILRGSLGVRRAFGHKSMCRSLQQFSISPWGSQEQLKLLQHCYCSLEHCFQCFSLQPVAFYHRYFISTVPVALAIPLLQGPFCVQPPMRQKRLIDSRVLYLLLQFQNRCHHVILLLTSMLHHR